MFKNDSMPVAASPKPSNINKCATAIKTVLRKRREKSLPSIRKKQDFDSQNALKSENGFNAIQIKSGVGLNRVYHIEKAEVVNGNFMKKLKTDKPKAFDKKHHSQSDKAQNREQIKKIPKKREPNNSQIKNQGKTSNLRQRIQEKKRIEEKQRIEEKKRREEKQRSEDKQRNEEKQTSEEKQRRREEKPFDENQCSQENTKSFSYKRKNLENRLTTKIWQILSRDVFLLDHDKFNNQIQATNSETKSYIISVIKKCNNKELKTQNRKVTQTSKETISSYRAGKRAIKCAVRRRVWKLAKASIKHSKHWSQFLAENHIILENINIDKFDLSLIDLDALGIENKILKRTITWLFN